MAWEFDKSIDEIKDYASEMKDSWERRTWIQRLFKLPIDFLVEGFRRMPYTLGHIVFWYYFAKWVIIPAVLWGIALL
jgi:hypothetical protein